MLKVEGSKKEINPSQTSFYKIGEGRASRRSYIRETDFGRLKVEGSKKENKSAGFLFLKGGV